MRRMLIIAAVALATAVSVSACEPKGPAEKAGRKIDRAAEEIKEKIVIKKEGPAEKVGRQVDEFMDETGKRLEKAATAVTDEAADAAHELREMAEEIVE